MRGRLLFQWADANKDGKVGLSEVREEWREAFKRLLARADKNHDQALSVEEAGRMRAAFVQRLRGGAPQPASRPLPGKRPQAQQPKPELVRPQVHKPQPHPVRPQVHKRQPHPLKKPEVDKSESPR